MEKNDKNAAPANSREEKKKALSAVFGAIEKQFGKGSIMKLGDATTVDTDAIPTGSLMLVEYRKDALLKYTGRNLRERQPLRCTLLPRHRKEAAKLHLLTRNTHLTLFMRKISA